MVFAGLIRAYCDLTRGSCQFIQYSNGIHGMRPRIEDSALAKSSEPLHLDQAFI